MTLRRCLTPLLAFIALVLATPAFSALDKDAKKWLDSVAAVMMPEELKIFEALKEKSDQLEFERIFWARRNPDLKAPENAYKNEYEQLRAKVDARIKIANGPGSGADCGKAIIFLGDPVQVKAVAASDGVLAINNLLSGGRNPEIWTFNVGGVESKVSFDGGCMASENFKKVLYRAASAKILYPNIDYRFTKEGHLVKLEDLLPKPSPAQNLLAAPKQDFPVQAQVAYVKAQGGGSAVLGVVRGEAASLAVDPSGKTPLKLVICALAQDAEGKVTASAEQEMNVELRDGAFLGTFHMGLKPGKYTLKAGALDPKSSKGSVVDVPIEVPDFDNGDLSASLMMLRETQDKPDASVDPLDPYAAFTFGKVRLIPYFGTTVPKGEPVYFFYQYYDAKTDEATHKVAAVTVQASVGRGTATLANTGEQTFESSFGGTIVGPIDLSAYRPGKYKFHIDVNDTVAQKQIAEEVLFEIAK